MAVGAAMFATPRYMLSPSPGVHLATFASRRQLSLSCTGAKLRTLRHELHRINVLDQAAGFGNEESFQKDSALVSEKCRALAFYLTTAVVALPLFIVMVLQHPLVVLMDRHRRKAQHLINKIWAVMSTYLFYKVEIIGKHNLPHPDEPAVYIANHQSFMDIFVLFQLGRPFKFISKTSVFWIPIVGWAMYLTGHIPVHRLDTKSQLDCLKRCIECLKKGVSVLFFPEGTRSVDGTLGAFKKGAFTAAVKARVPVVPIALVDTGKLMPNGKEYMLRSGKVKMVIHPPVRDGNADELCIQARDCIAATLSDNSL